MAMKPAFIVLAGRMFTGQTIRRDEAIIQVRTDAAPLVGRGWQSLCFHANGPRQGQALVGTAILTFDEAKAQGLLSVAVKEREGWSQAQEEGMFQRLLEAVGEKAQTRRKHYRGGTE